MYSPNVSIQNFFLMQPYPTGRYTSSHQTHVADQSIYPPSINPLALVGSSSIVGQHRVFYHQEILPPNSLPTPMQFINSTPSSYPAMIQSSNYAALSPNCNDSASLPTISELPTPVRVFSPPLLRSKR